MDTSLDQPSADVILQKYGRFGVNLGLSRIQALLQTLGNPQLRVPIVHVAGTNGKGSVCAYVSQVLSHAGYRVGRYTSPHLVSWRERICINQQPIAEADLLRHLTEVEAAIDASVETPTQFEVFTAAAWCYFAAQAVDIAVIEVGLGGRLDATNVCSTPLVTAVVSLSREHWQRLGPTLRDIAREKAGILKPRRPVVIGPLPPEADEVVRKRAVDLESPLYEVAPAVVQADDGSWCGGLAPGITYQPGLLGKHQRTNSSIAIAILQLLQKQGWNISPDSIRTGMAQTRWPGRLQWVTWQGRRLLIDGAHNPAAAAVLADYVRQLPQPTTWLMGMLATKDHADIFTALLQPGDRLHLMPVPGHETADPDQLGHLAQQVCPQLATWSSHPHLEAGLEATADITEGTVVLCGSLYLVGQFLQTYGAASP